MSFRSIQGWRLPIALSLVCLALGALLLRTISEADHSSSSAEQSVSTADYGSGLEQEPSEATVEFRMDPVHAYAEAVERPLFNEGRRPIEGESTPSLETEAINKPAVILRGTIVVAGGERIALFEAQAGTTTVRAGEGVEGWTVAIVEDHKVILERGAEQAEFSLDDTRRDEVQAVAPKVAPKRPRDRRQRLDEALTRETKDQRGTGIEPDDLMD